MKSQLLILFALVIFLKFMTQIQNKNYSKRMVVKSPILWSYKKSTMMH